jgi:outer membrane protein insertion porin family
VRENPVINRIVLEGNKRIKNDKILPEIKLAPRQIYTRSKVRADVDRIIELYRRQGRFAATVEPKIVQLDQNRVDLCVRNHRRRQVQGPRRSTFIGNEEYSDGTAPQGDVHQGSRRPPGFSSPTTATTLIGFPPISRSLRAFYLTEGYADFRVVSALAELTPDRRDFIITYVVEEGPRYKFGTVDARERDPGFQRRLRQSIVRIKPGRWFQRQAG